MTVDDVIAEYDVVGNPPDAFLPVVEMAAAVSRVPMATINIITSTAQHQVTTVGFDASVCRREDSMCARALETGGPVLVPDASRDRRFRDNPFVTGEIGAVRFYASYPLRTPEGLVIGSLCVFDEVPRELDAEQARTLELLASRLVDILVLSRRTRDLDEAMRHLVGLRNELRRSNEHLAAFTGQVSHDLAGPLSAVTMSLDLLDEEIDDHPDVASDLRPLVRSGRRGAARMTAMIHDYLALARLGGSLQREDVDLRGLVLAACDDVGLTGSDPGLVLRDLPSVRADPGQLRSVLQNLLSNAVKYGGDVVDVEVSARRQGDGWRVEVADRGPGVDPADADRLLEPFARSDQDGEVDGTGLGLATSRRIVRAHGGGLGLEPREGGGTVAWFTLPDVPAVAA
ncbi:MAG: GAF domain-containing sensor histidine kinase [Aeromicrobium erythreum]